MAGRVKSLAEDLVLTSGGPVSVLFTAQLPEERADAAVARTAMTVQRFVPQRVLGRSQGATVYAVLDSVTCTALALKAYPHATLTPLARHQVVRGSRVHTECSAHAHVLPLYAVFEDKVNIYQVMALGKGDLFCLLESRGRRLTTGQAVKYVIRPLLLALAEEVHRRGCIHRDIKPENLLLAEDLSVRLADFDLATDASRETPCTQVGTSDFMAPEVIKCPHKHSLSDRAPAWLKYTASVDIWAVGVLVFEVLTGAPPFGAATRADIKANVVSMPLQLPPWPENCCKFVLSCLNRDARKRPSADSLLRHAWIENPNS